MSEKKVVVRIDLHGMMTGAGDYSGTVEVPARPDGTFDVPYGKAHDLLHQSGGIAGPVSVNFFVGEKLVGSDIIE